MSRKNRPARNKSLETTATKTSFASGISASRQLVLGLILAGTFLAFSNTLFNEFAYDDTTQILQNQLIRSFSNIGAALTKEVWFWRAAQDKDPNQLDKPSTPYYRPVFTLYLMLGWQLFGTNAFGWHLANILMHLIAVYFAFKIMEKITGDYKLAGIATVLFAIHPLRSESVAWISGCTDLFLALFLLPSFYNYMLYRESGKQRNLIWALLLFFLAAFSKEPAVALPIMIIAYEVWLLHRDQPLPERIKPALLNSLPFFLLVGGYFMMRYKALGFVLSDANYKVYRFTDVLLTIPLVIVKYLGLLFLPLNLSVFHQTELVRNPLSYRLIVPVIVLAGLAYGLWQLRHNLVARFAILWFFINLLPVLNLSAFDENFMVQERYVYIPSIGFSLVIALAITRFPIEQWLAFGNRRTVQAAVILIIAALFTGKTWAQNETWKDDMTLWTHGAEVASDQPMASFILGHQYIKQQNPQKVIETFENYLKLKPQNLLVINNLAAAYLQNFELTNDRKSLDRARTLCEEGLKLNEQTAPLWDTLGHVYTYNTDLRNFALARAYFSRALQYEPNLMVSLFHLGATYVVEGANEEALRYLEVARDQQPDFPDTWKFLGYAYKGKGDTQRSVEAFNKYFALQPNAMDRAKVQQEVDQMKAKLQTAQR